MAADLVTDIVVTPVTYNCSEGRVTGTNLTYNVGGVPSSSRVPWVVSGAYAIEVERKRLQTLVRMRS